MHHLPMIKLQHIRSILFVLFTLLTFLGCQRPASEEHYSDRQRLMLDTTDNHTQNIDSLQTLIKKYRQSGERAREMGVWAEVGHSYQDASRYMLAIKAHREQAELAEELGDTLMKASALNDLAVNYRRMGLYYEGLNYHSQAIALSAHATGKDRHKFMKCEAIGYNGAGNVYLAIGHFKSADSMLRRALAIETKLGSHLGMNVDNSNLGMVFERRGMIDSAWVYFKRSYEHSVAAKSNTGMAYCHMNFGRMYQKAKEYDKAITEFQLAMDVVPKERDLWLWLQPCLAIAGVNVTTNNKAQAEKYLDMALSTAKRIQAKEYFGKIYRLYSTYYRNQGNYQRALDYYILADAAEDSLLSTKNLFEIESLQSEIAHKQSERRMRVAQRELSLERTEKWLLIASVVALLALSGLLWYIARVRLRTYRMQKNFMRVRNRFFTNITHEFRTPLTVILGMGEELVAGKQPSMEKQRSAGEMIVRQGRSLLSLVNQLLDISKVRSEVGEPEWRRGNVVPYIHMVVEGCQQLTKDKNITMLYGPKENEVQMDVVPDYLGKILRNLITNSVKFTPENGNVSITSQTRNGTLVLMVADDGVGIQPEHLDHLFEPFFQADNDTGNIGTGVGLSLVHQLVVAMKGDIKVTSAVGKGTVFTITLPLTHGNSNWPSFDDISMAKAIDEVKPGEAYGTPVLAEQGGAEQSAVSVLVVDDNTDVARYIGRQMPKGYRVYYATNGIDGLKKVNDLLPDLIITDLMMPGMDGLELCRQVRAGHSSSTIPVIIITAKTTQEDLEAGLRAGANAYLFKPFSGSELRIRMDWILTERRLLKEKFLLSSKELGDVKTTLSREDKEFVSQFTNAIYDQMRDTNIDIDALAMRLCMSTRSLRRKVSELTDDSLSNYISKIRVDYAKQLLKRNPEFSVNEVSLRCGFSDQSYFSRIFRQIEGVSPAQYRKNVESV